jgi:hypothetical protein
MLTVKHAFSMQRAAKRCMFSVNASGPGVTMPNNMALTFYKSLSSGNLYKHNN